MRLFLARLRLRTQLLLLAGLPLLGAVIFAGRISLTNLEEVRAAEEVQGLMALATRVGAVLHETQKERGATAIFMSSKGVSFRTELVAQRKQLDERLDALRQFLTEREFEGDVGVALVAAERKLASLAASRQKVDGLTAPIKEMIEYYTSTNKSLLDAVGKVSSAASSADLARSSAGYFAFLNAKERSGIERAQLASAFTADAFAPGQFVTVTSLIASQQTYFDVFAGLTEPAFRDELDRVLASGPSKAVARFRDVAAARAIEGDFGVDSGEWFRAKTEQIDDFKRIEDAQAASLTTAAEALHTSARESLSTQLILVGLMIALVLCLSIWIIAGLSGPIRELTETAEHLATGDLSTRIEHEGHNELGRLADAFRTMSTYIREVAQAADRLAAGDLTTAHRPRGETDVLGHSCATLCINLREIIGGLSAAGEQLGGGVDTMQEISGQLNDVAERTSAEATSAAGASEQMHASISEIAQNCAESAQLASSATESAEATRTVVSQLSESSAEIAGVLTVIANITEQTNLLALNATIEAARAGDAGKGFAVVANEVKDLARETARATDGIRAKVESIQSDTRSAVAAIGAISDQVRHVNEIGQSIASAVEEQSATTREIAGIVANVACRADESKLAAGDSKRVSDDMGGTARMLREMVGRFRFEST